jgi:translation initiation factor 2 subunit 1
MLLSKQGFPEEDELVLCTVTNIHYHSVFVRMDEYDRTGLIHISEVSPGRIRNIRDFVEEGKKVVCKVLKIDKKKGHVDLSLRRVNDNQKRKKVNEIKEEQKAEKIIELIAKNNNKDPKKLFFDLSDKILKKYEDIRSCFKDTVKKPDILTKLGVDKDLSEQLTELIKTRFKEEDITIGGKLKITSYEPNGLEIVKKALLDVEKVDKSISLLYAGGGTYNISVTQKKYKDAEKILEKALKKVHSIDEKDLGKVEFKRKEKKE